VRSKVGKSLNKLVRQIITLYSKFKLTKLENPDLLNNDLQVSAQAQSYLTESARWGKFLAIIGFILCGIMAVVAFFVPAFLSRLPPYNSMPGSYASGMQAAMTIVYLLLALLLFFPFFYLYKFSVKMQSAIKMVSQQNFDESLMNLKSMFKFYGILTIILLSFYALIFVIAIISLAMKG
jgi:hypothetical protein